MGKNAQMSMYPSASASSATGNVGIGTTPTKGGTWVPNNNRELRGFPFTMGPKDVNKDIGKSTHGADNHKSSILDGFRKKKIGRG